MDNSKPKTITGKQLLPILMEALGIDNARVQRIVLDVDVLSLPVAYVQLVGDERLLEIDWAGNMEGVEVHYAPPAESTVVHQYGDIHITPTEGGA